MNILICGANGFVGRHLSAALRAVGHEVVRGVRTPTSPSDIAIDFAHPEPWENWLPQLQDIDVVINAVGILCEGKGATFNAIHRDSPIALFDACEAAGVMRVIQISALGGGAEADWTPYMRTKRDADAHLMKSDLDWLILRPSLVVGIDGDSSRFFRTLASLPVVGLPGRGDQLLQPVHVDDLCQVVVRAIAAGQPSRTVLDVVGPAPMTYREMLALYRQAMEMPAPLWLPVPMSVMKLSALIAAKLPQRVFSPDTVLMLEQGNVSHAGPVTQVLGRAPLGAASWATGATPDMLRSQAIMSWALPLLRMALALVWLVSGILSFGIYPISDSLALLAQVGVHGSLAILTLYGTAALDCLFGIATLLAPSRMLWRMQFLLVFAYTVIISVWLPGFWLHPFGPILKNLPILALLLVLDANETRRT
ncbi:SDR family oxidoreductase [soil metagenome]